ncbi:MAG: DUF488 family protein [Deltaproteobacteria bacterium]|nr:DUF488 family protein [Deltaproteobacteria bacterium]
MGGKHGGGRDVAKIKLKTYRCGSPRGKDEGLRIGAVRFLPRGVKKEDYAKLDYFDVWFPNVAPSKEAVKDFLSSRRSRGKGDKKKWEKFAKRYGKEIEGDANARHAIGLLAEVAKRTPLAVGCYCEDENLCHRSILRELIEKEAGE